MKIESYDINLGTTSSSSRVRTNETKVDRWVSRPARHEDELSLSQEAMARARANSKTQTATTTVLAADERVWTGDASGHQTVESLKDGSAGAIALQHVATSIDAHDSEGALAGRVQSSGAFLQESGAAATNRPFDLATEEIGDTTTRISKA